MRQVAPNAFEYSRWDVFKHKYFRRHGWVYVTYVLKENNEHRHIRICGICKVAQRLNEDGTPYDPSVS